LQTIAIRGTAGRCRVVTGERLENLGRYLPDGKIILITDGPVQKAHGQKCPPMEVLETGTGERSKTLDAALELYEGLLRLECDRSSFIVGMGGGIVCDLTGFVASTYMRGVPFGLIPTTLLAQVDAAVGGKNGVNLRGYKNMIGVFSQPRFVLCDVNLLGTLPHREIRNGLAEVVKHGAIADGKLIGFLETHGREILNRSPDALERLVTDSIRIKAAVVNRDERERGERRLLNFGHTFGHALEREGGLSHGEAVAVGMAIAAGLSATRGLLAPPECRRLYDLLRDLGLPFRPPMDPENLVRQIAKDKKRRGDYLYFVWLHRLGEAVVEPINYHELEEITHMWWQGVLHES